MFAFIVWLPVNVLVPRPAKLPVAVTPPCQEEPLYTLSSSAVVLKNKSPSCKWSVGLLEPIRYWSAKLLTLDKLLATELTFAIEPPTLFTLDTALLILLELPATAVTLLLLPATALTLDILVATVFTLAILPAVVFILLIEPATVETSVAFGTNLWNV